MNITYVFKLSEFSKLCLFSKLSELDEIPVEEENTFHEKLILI